MRRLSEKGEGKLGGIIVLLAILALGIAAWNTLPPYLDHYDFVDKVKEICRTPRYKLRGGDDALLKLLMDEVSKRRLQDWIGPESFTITTSDTSRQIQLYYEREIEVLPGWKKNLKFEFTADEPLI